MSDLTGVCDSRSKFDPKASLSSSAFKSSGGCVNKDRLALLELPGASKQHFKTFNVAEHLYFNDPRYADRDYEGPKELGNRAFRDGEYQSAVDHYSTAITLALGCVEGGGFFALLDALNSQSEETARKRFSEVKHLATLVLKYLRIPHAQIEPPAPGMEGANYPNLGAAICLANRSAAYLKLGNAAMALEDANRAAKCAPEYVKAHRRKLAAEVSLGNKPAAKEIRDELKDYDKANGVLPLSSSVLLACGWITWEDHQLVYERVRFRAAVEHIRETSSKDFPPVKCHFSLVSFQSGQNLMQSVHWSDENTGLPRTIEGLAFLPVDNSNGDDLDLPPHGKASPLALKHSLTLIPRMVEDLEYEGINLFYIQACQGLVEHVSLIDDAVNSRPLKEEGEKGRSLMSSDDSKTQEKRPSIMVVAATTTGASEQADGVAYNPFERGPPGECPVQ
mmetsp:Transcript_63186/g.118739  ORF Transcript_63186/g.118739 Transcript_63186/m.118739 type:complete len:449 (-) Transcript_63186:25-1371(-)